MNLVNFILEVIVLVQRSLVFHLSRCSLVFSYDCGVCYVHIDKSVSTHYILN